MTRHVLRLGHARATTVCALLMVSLWTVTDVSAQPLGTFRWQLLPYCNVLTLDVTQSGSVYTLDGFDDQCGASARASVTGTAFLNPDGTSGIGLNIVSTPGGAPVHVDAAISVSTLSGSWRDSAGNSGTLTFRTGAGSGGTPRPAAGAIGAASVNPNQVQLRVGGTCASGSFIQSVGQDGSVSCGSAPGGIASVSAGAGLTGGGSNPNVSLSLAKTASGAFNVSDFTGILSAGVGGPIPATGAGVRFMWFPQKSAIRAGGVSADHWDDASIGFNSVAFGANTRAVGTRAVAMGGDTTATGEHAFAMGNTNTASGGNSTVFGALSAATAYEAVAMGLRVTAGANGSVVLGTDAVTAPAATGTFIFADRSTTNSFGGFAPNEFLVRAAGGTGIYSNAALTSGVTLAPGASAWAAISDVNMKENFRDLDGDDVLAKIARMPIREWNYKAQDAAVRHVGPTAQDFHAAFGLGEDPLRISTIDADGIALAGIKALAIENQALKAAVAALRERLERLEGTQR